MNSNTTTSNLLRKQDLQDHMSLWTSPNEFTVEDVEPVGAGDQPSGLKFWDFDTEIPLSDKVPLDEDSYHKPLKDVVIETDSIDLISDEDVEDSFEPGPARARPSLGDHFFVRPTVLVDSDDEEDDLDLSVYFPDTDQRMKEAHASWDDTDQEADVLIPLLSRRFHRREEAEKERKILAKSRLSPERETEFPTPEDPNRIAAILRTLPSGEAYVDVTSHLSSVAASFGNRNRNFIDRHGQFKIVDDQSTSFLSTLALLAKNVVRSHADAYLYEESREDSNSL